MWKPTKNIMYLHNQRGENTLITVPSRKSSMFCLPVCLLALELLGTSYLSWTQEARLFFSVEISRPETLSLVVLNAKMLYKTLHRHSDSQDFIYTVVKTHCLTHLKYYTEDLKNATRTSETITGLSSICDAWRGTPGPNGEKQENISGAFPN